MSLVVHPAADLFPMLDEARMLQLQTSIETNGLRHSVLLDKQGRVIDGRNRLEACRRAKVEPHFETFPGDEDAILELIADENLNRRDLSASQRAQFAAALVSMKRDAARAAGRVRSEGDTLAEAARDAGVSRATVKRAARVEREAPDLAEKVRRGETTVKAADEQLRQRRASTSGDTKSAPESKQGVPGPLNSTAEPKTDTKSAPPAPLLDLAGHPVPELLAPIFTESKRQVAELRRDLAALADRAEVLYSSGFISWDVVSEYLRKASAMLPGTLPGAVCQDCAGKGCKACSGRGWIAAEAVKAKERSERLGGFAR